MSAHFDRETKLNKPRALLPPLIDGVSGTWIDAASGEGVFAQVLLELAKPKTTVICFDLEYMPLQRLKSHFYKSHHTVTAVQADLRSPVPVKGADGLILANALHFFTRQDQVQILRRCSRALTKDGKLILVEYNTRRSTGPVPYPVPFTSVTDLLTRSGLPTPSKRSVVRSSYLGEMYAILAEMNSSD